MNLPDELIINSGMFKDHPVRDQKAAEKWIEDAEQLVALVKEIRSRISDGSMFVKFVQGDRKGSIARLRFDKDINHPDVFISTVWLGRDETYRIQGMYTHCNAVWSSPSRKAKLYIPDQSVVLLPNYKGKTVYKMFDRAAVKKSVLESIDERDIDGAKLSVGDKVLYINTRYGSGSCLFHGVVKEFKVSANSSGHSVSTVIQEDKTDMISIIASPSIFVWKKP